MGSDQPPAGSGAGLSRDPGLAREGGVSAAPALPAVYLSRSTCWLSTFRRLQFSVFILLLPGLSRLPFAAISPLRFGRQAAVSFRRLNAPAKWLTATSQLTLPWTGDRIRGWSPAPSARLVLGLFPSYFTASRCRRVLNLSINHSPRGKTLTRSK